MKWFLQNEPKYQHMLRRVWLWKDWPGRWGRDAGIDLVAEAIDGALWAIQAKAYSESYWITKSDVDKFLSESSRKQFAARLLIGTTNHLGATARRTIEAQEKPVHKLLRSELEAARVAWPSSYDALRPVRTKPASPREHQALALRDIVRGFAGTRRGQVIMACGTGKTLVGLWAAERLRANSTLVLLPSLSLVAQTLDEWACNTSRAFAALAVCSDEGVVDKDSPTAHTSDLPYPVTTDPSQIAAFLRRRGRKVVFSTYHSSPCIATAFLESSKTPAFDLVIADEAHRCAGRPDAAFGTILDENAIKARKRLFMTATPRYASGRLKREALEGDIEISSMDDPGRFGPEFHRLTFADAIEQDLLSDYQVAIVVVDDVAAHDLVQRRAFVSTRDGKTRDAGTIAAQLGLATAMKKYNLRRIVSFHGRVEWARSFATTFAEVVEWMPQHKRPTGSLSCDYVSGAMPTDYRRTRLEQLRNVTTDQRGLLANARCLTEGINVPTLDGVVFVDPRRSEIDVVQAVGRAIRKADDKKIGTIVLPVFVEKKADAIAAIEGSAFDHVWQIIQALRAHDGNLAADLDGLRREIGRRGSTDRLPAKIELLSSVKLGIDFVQAFDTQLVEKTTESWEFWFGLLEDFVSRQGHVTVPKSYVTPKGFKLGDWVANQRSKRERLPIDRVKLLEALKGWTWAPNQDAWERGFQELEQFVTREGDAVVTRGHVTRSGFLLGQWVTTQRALAAKSELPAARRKRLSSLRGWTWAVRADAWEDGFRLLQDFVRQEGHATVPQTHLTSDGFALGTWVATQRAEARKQRLSRDKMKRLAALKGWSWAARMDRWDTAFGQLESFVKRTGSPNVPQSYVTQTGFRLGEWLNNQRAKFRRARLSAERIQRFTKLKGWTWAVRADSWESALSELKEFVRREGHATVPGDHITREGFGLGAWVTNQRAQRVKGQLEEARVKQLERIPDWIWQVREDSWSDAFRRLEQFAQREGHARVPQPFVTSDGFRLGSWVTTQRMARKKRQLSTERTKRLEGLPGWTWDARSQLWEDGVLELLDFVRHEGHARVPRSFVSPRGFKLGVWATAQRSYANAGQLSRERMAQLAKLPGWTLDPQADAWEEGFLHLATFAKREGHARPPKSCVTADGFRLGSWVDTQRALAKKNRLLPARAAKLAKLRGWAWGRP